MRDKEEQNDLVQDWIDRSALSAIQMSEDELGQKHTSTVFRNLAGLQSKAN